MIDSSIAYHQNDYKVYHIVTKQKTGTSYHGERQ